MRYQEESQPQVLPLALQNFEWTSAGTERRAAHISAIDETESLIKDSQKLPQLPLDTTASLDEMLPTSIKDFERLLMSDPDSSFLWIQYMSYHLQFNEISQARQIAQRALRTINYRQEDEKLKIWIALLNLESTFGNINELEKCLNIAIQSCNAKQLLIQAAFLFEQANNKEVRHFTCFWYYALSDGVISSPKECING